MKLAMLIIFSPILLIGFVIGGILMALLSGFFLAAKLFEEFGKGW